MLMFVATGDEGFDERCNRLAVILAARGVASMIVESPFYGLSRPAGQIGVFVKHVSDGCMCGCVCCGIDSSGEDMMV